MDVSSLSAPSKQANLKAEKAAAPAREKLDDAAAKSSKESAPAARPDFLSGQNLNVEA